MDHLPSGAALLLSNGEFGLDSVDAVDAVDEQDENEYEGDLATVSFVLRNAKFHMPYLHAILELSDERVAGDELEEAALHLEGHRNDERHEQQHLEHEKCEDLI